MIKAFDARDLNGYDIDIFRDHCLHLCRSHRDATSCMIANIPGDYACWYNYAAEDNPEPVKGDGDANWECWTGSNSLLAPLVISITALALILIL